MSKLYIKLFGSPSILVDDTPCHFKLKKSQALLIYCICNPGPIPRQRLSDLLGNYRSDDAASRDLSNSLFHLKKDLRSAGADPQFADCMIQERETIEFDRSCNHYCDLHDFMLPNLKINRIAKMDSIELARAASVYRGPFLDSFDLKRADIFGEWISEQRPVFHDRYVDILHRLSVFELVQGNFETAILWLTRLQGANKEELPAYGLQMLAYAALGRPSAAKSAYRRFEKLIQEIDSPELTLRTMQELHAKIQRKEFDHARIYKATRNIQTIAQMEHDPDLGQLFKQILKSLEFASFPPESKSYTQTLRATATEAIHSSFSLAGVPHLFLALYKNDESLLRRICRPLELSKLAHATRAILVILGHGPTTSQSLSPSEIPHTLELQKILENACTKAEDNNAAEVSVAHLWWALLHTENNLVQTIFSHHNIKPNDLVTRLDDILSRRT